MLFKEETRPPSGADAAPPPRLPPRRGRAPQRRRAAGSSWGPARRAAPPRSLSTRPAGGPARRRPSQTPLHLSTYFMPLKGRAAVRRVSFSCRTLSPSCFPALDAGFRKPAGPGCGDLQAGRLRGGRAEREVPTVLHGRLGDRGRPVGKIVRSLVRLFVKEVFFRVHLNSGWSVENTFKFLRRELDRAWRRGKVEASGAEVCISGR